MKATKIACIYTTLIATSAFAAAPPQCKLSLQNFKCEILSKNSTTIATLKDSQASIYAEDLDALPTIIIYSNNPDELRNELSEEKYNTSYHQYLPLPEAERISSIEPLPQDAIELLKLQDWVPSNAKMMIYENPNGEYVLTCVTLENFSQHTNTAILQCSGFYSKDIQRLKELTKEIEKHRKIYPTHLP